MRSLVRSRRFVETTNIVVFPEHSRGLGFAPAASLSHAQVGLGNRVDVSVDTVHRAACHLVRSGIVTFYSDSVPYSGCFPVFERGMVCRFASWGDTSRIPNP